MYRRNTKVGVSNKLGFPSPREGGDGDIEVMPTPDGVRLFVKSGTRWYNTLLSEGNTLNISKSAKENISSNTVSFNSKLHIVSAPTIGGAASPTYTNAALAIANAGGTDGFFMDENEFHQVGDHFHMYVATADKNFRFFLQGSEKVTFEAGGNVGIGTAEPASSLHIIDTSAPSGASASVIIEGREDGGASILALRAKDEGSPTLTLPEGQGPTIKFQGFDGTDFENMGTITCYADGQAVATADAPSRMHFNTSSDGSSSPTTKMTIKATGKVGIGTTDPDELLTVSGAANPKIHIKNTQEDDAGIKFSDSDDVANQNYELLFNSGTQDLRFKSANAGTPLDNVLYLDKNGKVGIGIASPGVELEVASSSATNSYIEINANDSYNCGIIFTESNHRQWTLQHMTSGDYNTQGDLRVYDYSDSSAAAHLSPGDGVWQAGSDERIKKDVENIDSVLSGINSLRPVTWKRKYSDSGRTYAGLIAQEVKPHFPLTVGGTEDSFKEIPPKDAVLDSDGNVQEEAVPLRCEGGLSIGYSGFVPYLIKAIQELSAKVEALENNN